MIGQHEGLFMQYKEYYQQLAKDLYFEELLKAQGKGPYNVDDILLFKASPDYLKKTKLPGPLFHTSMGSQFFDSVMLVNDKNEIIAGHVTKDQFYKSPTGECSPEFYIFNLPAELFAPDTVHRVKDIASLEKISVILHNQEDVPSELILPDNIKIQDNFFSDYFGIKEFHLSIKNLLDDFRYPYAKDIESNYGTKDVIILLDGYESIHNSHYSTYLTSYADSVYNELKYELDKYIVDNYDVPSIKISQENRAGLLQYCEQSEILEFHEKKDFVQLLSSDNDLTPQDIRLIYNIIKPIQYDYNRFPCKDQITKTLELMDQSLTPINNIFQNILEQAVEQPVLKNKNDFSI